MPETPHEAPQNRSGDDRPSEEARQALHRHRAARWVLLRDFGMRVSAWGTSPSLERVEKGLDDRGVAQAHRELDYVLVLEKGQRAGLRTVAAQQHEPAKGRRRR